MFDAIIPLISILEHGEELTDSLNGTSHLNNEDIDRSKACQEHQFSSDYQITVLFDDLWLKITLIKHELNDG